MTIFRLAVPAMLLILLVAALAFWLPPIWGVLTLLIVMVYGASVAYLWRADLYTEFYASDPEPLILDETLQQKLSELAAHFDIRMPAIYQTNHDYPLLLSLFATKKDQAILISKKMLDTLAEHEKLAVFAHEYAHIANRHTARYTLLITFFAALNPPLVARAILSDTLGSKKRAGFTAAARLVHLILLPVFYLWLPVFVAKQDDFAADLAAVRATKDPIALINAINKFDASLRNAGHPKGPLARTSSFFFFAPPMALSHHLAVIPSLDERRWKLFKFANVEEVQERALGW